MPMMSRVPHRVNAPGAGDTPSREEWEALLFDLDHDLDMGDDDDAPAAWGLIPAGLAGRLAAGSLVGFPDGRDPEGGAP